MKFTLENWSVWGQSYPNTYVRPFLYGVCELDYLCNITVTYYPCFSLSDKAVLLLVFQKKNSLQSIDSKLVIFNVCIYIQIHYAVEIKLRKVPAV